jgi:hypothetical protein
MLKEPCLRRDREISRIASKWVYSQLWFIARSRHLPSSNETFLALVKDWPDTTVDDIDADSTTGLSYRAVRCVLTTRDTCRDRRIDIHDFFSYKQRIG